MKIKTKQKSVMMLRKSWEIVRIQQTISCQIVATYIEIIVLSDRYQAVKYTYKE